MNSLDLRGRRLSLLMTRNPPAGGLRGLVVRDESVQRFQKCTHFVTTVRTENSIRHLYLRRNNERVIRTSL